jgi:hypothetical protein
MRQLARDHSPPLPRVSSVNWSNARGPIQDDGTNKTLIVDPPTGNRFYRLFKP